MDRNEFMELVYETFADEPDNVLANGIIEAADAYAEHEKAKLFSEGTTKDTISRQAAIDVIEDYPHGNVWNVESMEEMVDKIKTLPTAQPVATYEQVEEYCKKRCLHVVTADFFESTKPQRLGHWILYDKRFPWRTWYKCSECGNYLDFSGVNGGRAEPHFCPNCGAKMKGATE